VEAARLGICIDLYAVGDGEDIDFGLLHISSMTQLTNGNLRLYNDASSPATCTLSHDLYKQLKSPHAFRGLLRMRTSSEFAVGRAHGVLSRDDKFPSILCMPGCDAFKTFAFDFQYTSSWGLGTATPALQMAFEYTTLEPVISTNHNDDDDDDDEEVDEGGSDDDDYGDDADSVNESSGQNQTDRKKGNRNKMTKGKGGGGRRIPTKRKGRSNGTATYRVVTRLRVETFVAETSEKREDIYTTSDPYVIITHLVHQALDEARILLLSSSESSSSSSLKDVQDLLRSWLVELLACYNLEYYHQRGGMERKQQRGRGRRKRGGRETGEEDEEDQEQQETDISFSKERQMQAIPRLVFALIKSSLLRPDELPSDARAHLHSLYAAMGPDHIVQGLYPTLSSWKSLEIENERGLLLSKASLSEDMPIYVLDAVSAVLVLYTNNALNSDPKLPYPPPHTCALRKQIKASRAELAQLSPRVLFIRIGTPEFVHFESHLVEEANLAGPSFKSFIESVAKDVRVIIQEEIAR